MEEEEVEEEGVLDYTRSEKHIPREETREMFHSLRPEWGRDVE